MSDQDENVGFLMRRLTYNQYLTCLESFDEEALCVDPGFKTYLHMAVSFSI